MRYLIFLMTAFTCIIHVIILHSNYSVLHYVPNEDKFLMHNIEPYLQTIFSVKILVCIIVYYIFAILLKNYTKKFIIIIILCVLGYHIVNVGLQYIFYKEEYYVWKFSSNNYDYTPINSKSYQLYIHDLQSSSEDLRLRCKEALAIGKLKVDSGYEVLQSITEDTSENKYLRFNCFKSMYLIDEKRMLNDSTKWRRDIAFSLFKKYTL